MAFGAESGAMPRVLLAALVVVISFLAFYISRRMVRSLVHRLLQRTRFTWDDRLEKNKLLMRLTLFIPALIIDLFLPMILGPFEQAMMAAASALDVYYVLVAVLAMDALINFLHDIYQTFGVSRDIPLKGFAQVLKIILYGAGMIMVVSVLLDRSPVYLMSGLGALTAVLMLVFKDPILGFTAGIQLISNRMLKNGDWIDMPKYGADGDVTDITLTTVKVRNWDNTITTIPTYALINDSFKNWRGMQESEGRRIKRALHVDMNSIKFCTAEMVERFSGIGLIKDYIKGKTQEIERHNADLGTDAGTVANTRRLTNVGTFRVYAEAYLKHHPMINTRLTCMVRQLAPTRFGLPLEIYAFCLDKAWINYEAIQADIFDHLLAIADEFGLKIYQSPAGTDIAGLSVYAPS